MQKETISAKQLFSLIVLFELGTALVLPIGFVAEQSVWLSILLAMIGGILLYKVYEYLAQQYPGQALSEYIRILLGKYLAWPVNLLYLGFFIHNGARVLRETGELLVTSAYDQTPIFIICALLMLVVIYVLIQGVEVMARTSEIYLIIVFVLGAIGVLLVLLSNIIDLSNILPVLGKGWQPILKSSFLNIVMFPFGEMICFTAIFPYFQMSHPKRKVGIYALICSGVILSFTHALEICVLGANIYSRTTFPLFLAISKVNIMDFIQRMDAIVILTLIITAFFKCIINCFAAVSVAAQLFRVDKLQRLAVPIGLIMLIISMMTANNWAEFAKKGKDVIMGLLIPFHGIVLPILLWSIHLVRKRLRNAK